LFFTLVANAINVLSLLCESGRRLEGLDRSLSAPGPVGALALSTLMKAVLLFLISGVTSLSSLGSGDFGVSPAEESSKSLLGFRGVLKRVFHTGGAGKGFVGEDCWFPIALDFDGESNPLCVP
jgi:hypothetical protein